jgi:hypothetical protein
MSTHLTVSGWRALVLVLIVAGAAALHYRGLHESLDDQGMQMLKTWLDAGYMRAALRDTSGVPLDQLSAADKQRVSERVDRAKRVQIDSVRARGTGNRVVCRVELSLDGGPPPDGRRVRYIGMSYSLVTGWTYRQESSPVLYYLALW